MSRDEARKFGKSSSSGSGPRRSGDATESLHVAGLPLGMETEEVKKLLAAHGRIISCKVVASSSGDGKAAALVRFDSFEEAKRAKASLNGTTLPGLERPVTVRFADDGRKGSDGKGGRGFFGAGGIEAVANSFETNGSLPGGKGSPETGSGTQHALYIAGLPPDTANLHLYKLFASFGAIRPKGVHAMLNPDGNCKGIGFVNFLEETSAQAAIMMYNGAVLPDGTTLKVANKQVKGDRDQRNATPKVSGGSAAVGAVPKSAP